MKYQSLLHVFLQAAGIRKQEPMLLGRNSDGSWRSWTGAECVEIVRRLSGWMFEHGAAPGVGVAICAPSSPEWLFADLAIQWTGAHSVPMFPDLPDSALEHQVRDGGVGIAVLWNSLAWTEGIPEALAGKPCFWLEGNCGAGNTPLPPVTAAHASVLEGRLASIHRGELLSVIYTSGSTGIPKGVELTQGNLCSQVEAARVHLNVDGHVRGVSTLPLAHIFERIAAYYQMSYPVPLWFVDNPKSLGTVLREIRPTVMTVVPRLMERIHEAMWNSTAQMPIHRRLLVRLALARAGKYGPNDPLRRVFELLIHRKLLQATGGELKLIVSGGSALPLAESRFFRGIGLPLREGYGMTECSPVIAANQLAHNRPGTVGTAFPGVQIRIVDGEVQVRGDGVTRGYRNRPDLDAQAFTADHWFRTGDLGELSADGFLRITGRRKELCKLSTGKYVSLGHIEALLSTHPLIESALVLAEGHKFVAALLFPCHEAIARRLHKPLQEYQPEKGVLSRRIRQRLQHHIDRCNRTLPTWEKVKIWVLMPEAPSVADGGLTPTMKPKRAVLEDRYRDRIQQIYGKE